MGEAKRRTFLKEQVGATGKFPEGMIRPDDEGELRCAISDKDSDGNIHIHFGKPVAWIALSVDTAADLARALLRKAGAKKVEVTF